MDVLVNNLLGKTGLVDKFASRIIQFNCEKVVFHELNKCKIQRFYSVKFHVFSLFANLLLISKLILCN